MTTPPVPLWMRVYFFLMLPPFYLFTVIIGFLPPPARKWWEVGVDTALPRKRWTRAAWIRALDSLAQLMAKGGIGARVAAKALYDYYPAGHQGKKP